MDKETHDQWMALLAAYFGTGGSLEEAIMVVRAAWLDHKGGRP